MKMTSTSIGTPAAFVLVSLCHVAVSVQSYESNFAVAPAGAPAVDNSFEITRFGPAGCVSTWKNQASHCVIRTECKNQSLMEYNIRLICIDKGNERVRHVFGKGSFDLEETFDTLVVCDQCTAEEALQQGGAPAPAPAIGTQPGTLQASLASSFAAREEVEKLSATVQTLSTEVHELAVGMAANSESVKKLEIAVFGAGSSGASAQMPAMVAPTQVQAVAAPQPSATAAPNQDSPSAVASPNAGRRIVLRRRHLPRQPQQQKVFEEPMPVNDEPEVQKPTQQQLDAAEDRLQADSFAVPQDSDSFASGDGQLENNDPEFMTENADQSAEDEGEQEDGMFDNGEYN
mmetsp:Transcript_73926/g.142960  ORF Transcript_73926/g.142960 Transcript_73926/m.142960 type:complete len:345 (+) Transcript_73926:82-1116(+)